MSEKTLVVLGGGGHARVVIQAAQSSREWNVIGYVDPVKRDASRLGVPYLGEDAAKVVADPALARASFVLGVGSTFQARVRREIVERCRLSPARWASVVHARAVVSPTAQLGPGSVVLAGAVVNAGAQVGAHSIVNSGAIVEYDSVLGAYVHAAPAAVVAARAYLGIGCRIRERLTLGENVKVGMGAVVLRSVPSDRVVIGVPAKDMAPADER
jgi:acetyltransferase EpsM